MRPDHPTKDEHVARLIALLGSIYKAGSDASHWSRALNELRGLLDADRCLILSHDYATQRGRIEYAGDLPTDYARAYEERYSRQDPWVRRERFFRSAGEVWRGDEIVRSTELMRSAFYREFLEPQRMLHALLGVLDRRGSNVVYLAAGRREGADPFGQREIELLRSTMPALQATLHVEKLLVGAESMKHAALETLDVLPLGVCILNVHAELLASNQVAEEIFAAHDALHRDGDRLIITDAPSRRRFVQMLTGAPGQGRDGAELDSELRLPSPALGRPLYLLVSRTASGSRLAGGEHPAATVFVIDSDRPVEMNEDRLRRLYGLTPAEARLAALLAGGWRLNDAAQKLGISYQTARTHLKHVFSKTQTARQPELVRLILNGPAPIRA